MTARTKAATCRRRPTDRASRLIRQLCAERAVLIEEVKQLSAAVQIYRELARRAERSAA